jgi:putative endonuclease
MARTYFVYILASESRELYIGVTNDLNRRIAEHRTGWNPESYSSRHCTTRLVYFEMTTDVLSAIRREKRLKRLSRQRKLRRPPPPHCVRRQGDTLTSIHAII